MHYSFHILSIVCFNHYETVTYIYAYSSQAKDQTSEAMKQAAKGVFDNSMTGLSNAKVISMLYATKN